MIILFQLHAVFSVLHGVAKFNDCADAKAELVREIQDAKADLAKKNIF